MMDMNVATGGRRPVDAFEAPGVSSTMLIPTSAAPLRAIITGTVPEHDARVAVANQLPDRRAPKLQ